MVLAKKIAAILTILLGSLGIAYIFWHQDLQYRVPTPPPPQFVPVSHVELHALPVTIQIKPNKPYTLLHFFNPDCPCSRFNLRHLRQLQHEYRDFINVVLIVTAWADTVKALQMVDFASQMIVDYGLRLSKACGVYSSPQAVLFGPSGRSLYKGNYNTSRYCEHKETQFVRIAIKSNLEGRRNPLLAIDQKAYGCTFYQCTSSSNLSPKDQ
jgi:hypothetical protein